MKTIKVGSDFSGVGAFDYAIERVSKVKKFQVENVFACDMDKYARISYLANHKEPNYYPENVYDREIPSESLDIYMTSPPCQAFSLVGKRKGKEDKRGILFFNSHEFIKENKPRFFIFENVKGLLSDDSGRTFQEWVNMLGGKSVNGLPILFPYENSVPYHLYWQVLNTKKHGVPQNRERVFIIGIRDDEDNNFTFPAEEHLNKRLKDVLEEEVDEKYFLSHKMIEYISSSGTKNFYYKPQFINSESKYVKPITTQQDKRAGTTNYIKIKDTTDLPIYNDKRLNSTIQKNELIKGKCLVLDTYNQSVHKICPTLKARHAVNGDRKLWDGYKIRRLTPLECFRLQDFPDSHVKNSINAGVSDSQIYKQAGNSITVRVLEKIIDKMNL